MPEKQMTKQMSRQSSRQSSGELSKQSSRQSSGELSKQSSRHVSGELTKQPSKQTSGELTKQPSKQRSGEMTRQTLVQITKQGSLSKQGSMELGNVQSIGKHEQNQTEYALDLYKHVVSVEKADKNVVMSPASIATALAMTAAGAEGATLDQFVAHLKHKDAQAMHQFYLYIKNVIFRDSSQLGGPVLGIANGLWVDEKTPFDSRFTKFVKAGYGAETQETDFRLRAGEVCKDVNDWVRMQTQGQSTSMLATDALYSYTRLLVVNALYFKGTWKEKFDAKQTMPKTFHLFNGGTVSVPMMSSSRKHYIKSYSNWMSQSDISLTFSFNNKEDPWSFEEPAQQVVVQVQVPASATGAEDVAECATPTPPKKEPFNFKVLKLPYKTAGSKDTRSFSMYIFLPDKRDGLPELEKNLDAGWLMRELPTMTRLEPVGNLLLPKFKASFNVQANSALQSLGLTVPFSDRKADFSGMLMDSEEANDSKQPTGCFCYGLGKNNKRHFALSALVHEAMVEVNEDGTEAAAVGARVAGLTRYNSLDPLYKLDFVADHPFLYIIREDSTGVLMFVGRVANPYHDDAPLLDI